LIVDQDASQLPDIQAGMLRQYRVGDYPDRHHRQFAGQFGAVVQLDRGEPSFFAEEGRQPIAGDYVRALGTDMVFHQVGQIGVDEGEHLRHPLDHRNLDTGQVQGLADLETDETGADDDRPADALFVADSAQCVRFLQRVQAHHPVQVHAGYRGT
jgi:hypothetical protein